MSLFKEEAIQYAVSETGIPCRLKGYSYICEAERLAGDDPEMLEAVTKYLYPRLARIFSTSSVNVERAIRTAISKSEYCGFSNKEFLIKLYFELRR